MSHRRDLANFSVCSAALLVLIAITARVLPATARQLPVAKVDPEVRADSYLSTDNRTTLDQLVFYHQLENVRTPLAAASVVIAGNSRSLCAFREGVAEAFFRRHGCRWYHAGFPAESSLFTQHILATAGARPQLVIVNADDFFRNQISMIARNTIDTPPFTARTRYAESKLSYRARNRLHQFVPHLPTLFCAKESMVVHRSVVNGAWRVGAALGVPSGVDVVPGRDRASPEELRLARDFHDWVRSFGGELVLTYVPARINNRGRARHIAEHLGCRFIAPRPRGLRTLDGSHLDAASADKFAQAFFTGLEAAEVVASSDPPRPPIMPPAAPRP